MVPLTSSASARTLLSTGDSLPASPVFTEASSTATRDSLEHSMTFIMPSQRERRGSPYFSSSLMTPGGQTWSSSGRESIEKKAELSRTIIGHPMFFAWDSIHLRMSSLRVLPMPKYSENFLVVVSSLVCPLFFADTNPISISMWTSS